VYLSELNIVGFKSFAKNTQIIFHSGITGIVGPNGCGKSNIMDAIRWVMGEQKSGVLRSDRMENLIFNGSASAKPVGMAEVSLKIENTKNILPVDYTEVLIARRLFRSGESHYLINGNPVRLKDILDLFMDTGLGANTYSVIELSQVEQILNGKPEERRRIFEEAAGITKYKLRRKATFRKLEATEKDLIRVEDIMSEVEKSVRSLWRQVARAQKYQQISEELKTVEIRLATFEFSKIVSELEPMETSFELIQDDREAASTDLASKEAEYEVTRNSLLTVEKALSAEQTGHNEMSREIQKLEERILVNKERTRTLGESRERYIKEREGIIERLNGLKNAHVVAQEKYQVADKELNVKRSEYDQVQGEYEKLRADYDRKRTGARESEAEILRISEELSRKQNEGTRLKATEENISQRLRQLEQEENINQTRYNELVRTISILKTEEENLNHRLQARRLRYIERTKQDEEARHSLAGLQKAELEDRNRIEVLENQADMVKRLLESYEDYPSGVKYLATLTSESFSSFGAVANLFSVDSEHRAAVAAVLSDTATYLVVQDLSMALNGIGLLKQDKKGVVSFLPLNSLVKQNRNRPVVQDLGVVGWANELIKCQDVHRPLMDALLESCLVVQDIETANRIGLELEGFKIDVVTLAGEVISHWGMIRGGSRGKRQIDFVGRKEQLAELEQEILKIQQNIEGRRRLMVQRDEEARAARTEAEALDKEIKKLEEEIGDRRIELGRLTFEEGSLSESRRKRGEERERLLQEITHVGHDLKTQTSDTDGLLSSRQTLAEKVQVLSRELATMEKDLNDSAIRVREAQVSFTRLQSEYEAMKRENESIQLQMTETQRMIESRDLETTRAAEEINELTIVNQSLIESRGAIETRLVESQRKLDTLKDSQYEANVKANEQEKIIRISRTKTEEISESVHRIELRLSELRLRQENLKSRILQEFEFILKRETVDNDFDAIASAERVEHLRQRLKEIGPVNLLALKEYEQEKERLDFLQTQRDDLIKARRNLTETIEIINKTAREHFLSTFEKIQKNFSEVFNTFFDGGRANLVLQESADPLEADIEIYANPGGKRLSSIQLLSGGEKALTAISMLFAIYLVKPSPFCIFDEVDAPLDDQNVERFTRALKEFSKNTQFLIVTHNKLTMSSSDQLYGITMEEKGVSKVVSVKFDSAMKYVESNQPVTV
jgi:chromosome segregation protein